MAEVMGASQQDFEASAIVAELTLVNLKYFLFLKIMILIKLLWGQKR